MPFEIVRNDITNICVDAIVNSANPRPVVGLGTDSSIHEKAGPELLAARQKIGPISMGQAAITPAFRLQAKYVIHTVGPVWDGGSYGEEALLRSCYDQSLKLALEYGCQSIAFPLIATNNYGFPKDKALQIAVAAFSEFLLEHEMQIYLVVFDRGAYELSEKLFHSIASYIDDHYVQSWEESTYGGEMAGLEKDTIGGFNAMIEKQKQEEGEAFISTVLFDNYPEVIHDRVALNAVPKLTEKEYYVRGCTALLDAVGGAIHHIGNVHKYAREEDRPEKTLFVITTDGMENASRRYSYEKVKEMITRQKEKYGWEFLFLGANIDAAREAARFGIAADRATNYHADAMGTEVIYEAVCETVCDFRASRPMAAGWKKRIDEDFKKRGR